MAEAAPRPRRWSRVLLAALGCLVVIVAIGSLLPYRLRNAHGSDSRCVLHARAFSVGHEGAVLKSTLDVKNDDDSEWTDVTITVYGMGTSVNNKNEPTGAYAVHLDTIDAGHAHVINLGELQKPDGSRWVDVIMRATEITITARMRAESCKFDSPLKELMR